ncbi:hypothetical protein FHS18_005763 [Paenibacillus phyllosphaerae]|uniref:Uncharacterized protein n=1 Tax=Paenibacillus phyllosphaerae TaxID=274593 RepID=A0A7W5FQN9_9BACL|nr:hypothetical protein [Paenibacillus phyllosphaerae]
MERIGLSEFRPSSPFTVSGARIERALCAIVLLLESCDGVQEGA